LVKVVQVEQSEKIRVSASQETQQVLDHLAHPVAVAVAVRMVLHQLVAPVVAVQEMVLTIQVHLVTLVVTLRLKATQVAILELAHRAVAVVERLRSVQFQLPQMAAMVELALLHITQSIFHHGFQLVQLASAVLLLAVVAVQLVTLPVRAEQQRAVAVQVVRMPADPTQQLTQVPAVVAVQTVQQPAAMVEMESLLFAI
jgi:hypothetical protein